MDTNEHELIHKELCFKIVGAAFEVHNTLGGGFLEKVYENAMCVALRERGIPFETQEPLEVRFHDCIVGLYVADFVVDGVVLLELKACECLTDVHRAQVINYLRATGIRLGILMNFGPERLQWERIVV